MSSPPVCERDGAVVTALVVAVVSAAVLWGIGIQAKMLGSGYKTVSWRGALFFLGCMVALAVIEHFRRERTDAQLGRTWEQ